MIDEKILIDVMLKSREREHGTVKSLIDWFIDVINACPKANEWIPCNKKLPEKMEDVLVTQKYYDLDLEECCVNVNTACLDSDGNWFSVFNEEGYMEDYNVIAWMPLPEPYMRGEKND